MKRFATLVELMIALSLTTVLLAILLFVFRQSVHSEAELEKELWMAREEYALCHRLERVLPEATLADGVGLFCTSDNTLVFTYNNGIDKQKPFCGEVVSRLYLNNNGRLILATWPLPDRWKLDPVPKRVEVLYEGIESIKMRFYEPQEFDERVLSTRAHDPYTPYPDQGWQYVWDLDYGQLPALVEINLYGPGSSLLFSRTFAIAEADKPIRYYHKVQHRGQKNL